MDPSWSCATARLPRSSRRSPGEGVQSLLLEGGPTLAAAFLDEGLVDKILVFVAPQLSGEGPTILGSLASPLTLSRQSVQSIGEDLLVTAYVREP